MASPSYSRSLVSLTKRLKLSSPAIQTTPTLARRLHSTTKNTSPTTSQTSTQPQTLPPVDSLTPQQLNHELRSIRLPRAVQATYLTPLRRTPTYSEPSCDLQLRSYSVRNLEVFADFALRAAYYLNLPAKGPIPLPKITERWTVPRANFIFKKSQENFERVTTRRLIQIQDGHPETVSVWLAFLQKFRYYGIGMKANVFEHASLEEAYAVDEPNANGVVKKELQDELDRKMALLGSLSSGGLRRQNFEDMLEKEQFKGAWGGYMGPMVASQSTRGANRRARLRWVRAPRRVLAGRKVGETVEEKKTEGESPKE